MFRAQAITDIGGGTFKVTVAVNERLIIGFVLDDVVGDVVGDRQIGLRGKNHIIVGQLKAAMPEGRQHMHLATGFGQTRVGQTRPQDRVHLGHIGAPQNKHIGMFQIVITAHRLVNAKGAHKGAHS